MKKKEKKYLKNTCIPMNKMIIYFVNYLGVIKINKFEWKGYLVVLEDKNVRYVYTVSHNIIFIRLNNSMWPNEKYTIFWITQRRMNILKNYNPSDQILCIIFSVSWNVFQKCSVY